jgi:putative hydrolase of the HAD superfamily
MPVKTIIFDLGRTLVPFSLEPLRPQLNQPDVAELCRSFESGRIAPQAFPGELCRLTAMPAGDFEPWWNAIFEPEWLVPQEYVRGLLSRYRVGLLSNTNALHFEYLRREHPLLEEFDFHILSHEVGAAKPEPLIYEAAEAGACCAPEEILYFDDVAEFVAAARRRRWQAHQFTSAASVFAVLP